MRSSVRLPTRMNSPSSVTCSPRGVNRYVAVFVDPLRRHVEMAVAVGDGDAPGETVARDERIVAGVLVPVGAVGTGRI